MMQELYSGLNKKNDSKALVLFSSGLDSVYNLLKTKKEFKQVTALFFDYGQKAASQEYIHVKKICSKIKTDLIRIDLPWYKELNSSLLNFSSRVAKFADAHEADLSKSVSEWVPNRNGVFVSIAGAVAESNNIGTIVIGLNKEEAERYPDNSKDFLEKSKSVLQISTLSKPTLVSFSIDMDKQQIVSELYPLMKEFLLSPNFVWSCYESFEKMCGSCESCVRLKRAVSKNMVENEWKELFLK